MEIRAGDVLLFERSKKDMVSGVLNRILKMRYSEYRRILKALGGEWWHAAPVLSVVPMVSVTVMEAQKGGNKPKEFTWQYIKDHCLIFRMTHDEPTAEDIEQYVKSLEGTDYDFGAYAGTVLVYLLNLKLRLVDNQFHCWEITCLWCRDVLHKPLQAIWEYPIISKMLPYLILNQVGRDHD